MKNQMIKNGLAAAVILLFLGVGIQSVFAMNIEVNNNPPDAPIIDGPDGGIPEILLEYSFTSMDPDGDDIAYYFVCWGDTWAEFIFGPFKSGEEVFTTHSWDEKGTYTIKAIANDVHGAESDWSYFEINIPRTRTSSYHWYEWLLERFPLLERLLNKI